MSSSSSSSSTPTTNNNNNNNQVQTQQAQQLWSKVVIKENLKTKIKRSSHSSVLLNNNNLITIFGGYDPNNKSTLNDLIFYDIEKQSWLNKPPQQAPAATSTTNTTSTTLTNIKTKIKQPLKRMGHSSTLLNDNNSFLIFGGMNSCDNNSNGDSDDELIVYSDLFIYDQIKNEWKLILTNGDKPSARQKHSACLVDNNKLYIFGGNDGYSTTFNSLYLLNLDTMKWSIPQCNGDTPPFSWGHTCTLYNNCLYFYGGSKEITNNNSNSNINSNNSNIYNNLSILNLNTMTWKVNVPTISSTGPLPSSRIGHTFTKYEGSSGNLFILIGGSTSNNGNTESLKVLNDCFIFSPDTLNWRHISGNDNLPPQRSFHSANLVVNSNQIYIYGGINNLNPTVVVENDIHILDIEKVLLKLENQPKKRIRLRPVRISSLDNSNNSNNSNHNTSPSPSSSPSPILNPNSTTTKLNSSSESLSLSSPILNPTATTTTTTTIADTTINNIPNINTTTNNSNVKKMKTPSTIVEWLNQNGLQKYKDNFIMNDITLDNLNYLTEKHLIEDLCIPTLGARLKILNCLKIYSTNKGINNNNNNNNNSNHNNSNHNNSNHNNNNNHNNNQLNEQQSLQESIANLKTITDNLSLSLSSLTLTIQNLSLSNNSSNNSTPGNSNGGVNNK